MRAMVVLLLCLAFARQAGAEATQLRIGGQYGTSMLAVMLMEHGGLVQKHAAAAGLGEVAVTYRNISGPVAMSDGVISGALDIGINGAPSVLLLWDKTRGGGPGAVRGLASVSANPSILVTRNPAVHSIRDFSERDRIAMPGVKIALNAILLQMAAAKEWGPSEWQRLDARTTTLGHPDALAAMLSGAGEITAHFSGPPFSTIEIKAGMRPILRAHDVLGDGWDMLMFATARFRDANPKLVGAVLAALAEAQEQIRRDPRAAAEIYLSMSGDKKSSVDDILALITDPDTSYGIEPRSVMRFAAFMASVGMLRRAPSGWEDVFFPDLKR
jgi:NitT/TauT family transport system substrate-binding protein